MQRHLKNERLDLIARIASKFGVDVAMTQAIAMVETNLEPQFAYYDSKYYDFCEPEFYSKIFRIDLCTEINFQKTSWGIMGINGAVARRAGFGSFLPTLINEETNLEWSVRHLSALCAKYPGLSDRIAAYDSGSPFRIPNGDYINQLYVDTVRRWMGQYQRRGFI